MAREPTTILEAFTCHPSAIVEVRVAADRAMSWTWHAACVAEGGDITGTARAFPRAAIFVHEHIRDYLTDCPGADEHHICSACHDQLRYLPRGRSL